jgi:hypothetical protein
MMRVFVLTTGRSGSTTFARACAHINNFTVGHESRWGLIGIDRFRYAEQHIEVDNRLAWLLGRIEEYFGAEPFYVHLIRDRTGVAQSYFQRRLGRNSIIRAYSYGILYRDQATLDDCLDYYETINANIRFFLQNKPNKLEFDLAQSEHDFRLFWEAIGAQGDLQAGLDEWKMPYNKLGTELGRKSSVLKGYEKIKRIAGQLPDFLKNA